MPEGFDCRSAGGKFYVFKVGWGEEIRGLAERGGPSPEAGWAEVEYLSGRGRLAVVTSGRGKLVVRHYFHGGVFRRLTRDLLRGVSRPMKELKLLTEAARARIRVPEAVGLIIDPAGAGLVRAALITIYIPDSYDLFTYLRQWPADPSPLMIRKKREIIAETGALIAALHRSGFNHADLQLKNITIQQSPAGLRIFILDFDKATHDRPPRSKVAVKNLLRLYRSFRKLRLVKPALSPRDPLRFLNAYAPEDKEFRRYLVRQARRRRWRDSLHLIKWKLLSRLRGSPYAQPMSGDREDGREA